MSQSFDLARFDRERAARGVTWGSPVSWQTLTDSTNDDALLAAKAGAPHGALFGAESQARGRGRRGSEWLSAPGEGLWFSLVLRPEFRPELAPAIALCAGLSVRAAVAELLPVPVLVKWPNDVWAAGRKLAGVLVESQVSGAKVQSVIVGIGINVSQQSFPPPLAETATSLELLSASKASREVLLAMLLDELSRRWTQLEARGVSAISQELAAHDALLGRRLRVEQTEGIARGIDAEGRLLLETPDGRLEPVISGHVELVR